MAQRGIVVIENPVFEDRLQRRFHLPDLIRAQHGEFPAAFAHHVHFKFCAGKTGLTAEDLQHPAPADHRFRVRLCDQRVIGRMGDFQQPRFGPGIGADPVLAAVPCETDQPGQQFRQIAPADRQRTIGIHQHFRHPADDPRHGSGDAAGDADNAGITHRGAGADFVPFENGDIMAVALQEQGRADTRDAAADNGDPARVGSGHNPASSSSMKPSTMDRPSDQNFGSDASRPNGASNSLCRRVPPARSIARYFSTKPSSASW